LKDVLKSRGYRWSNGSDDAVRAWFIDVAEEQHDAEMKYLRDEIYKWSRIWQAIVAAQRDA